MASFFIVPFIVSVDDHLRMIDGFKFKSLDHFPLQDGVQGFDVGVVFRGGYMGKLLVNRIKSRLKAAVLMRLAYSSFCSRISRYTFL